MNKLTEKQKSYIAGIVDGEGSISIDRVMIRGVHRNWSYLSDVSVINTDLKLHQYLRTITGTGSINDGTIRYGTVNSKKIYQWSLLKHQMKSFLETILNDLILKKERAIVMLEFLETYKIKYNRYNPPPESILIEREILYEEMIVLNQRGLVPKERKSKIY